MTKLSRLIVGTDPYTACCRLAYGWPVLAAPTPSRGLSHQRRHHAELPVHWLAVGLAGKAVFELGRSFYRV
jgi:hypothetical protein